MTSRIASLCVDCSDAQSLAQFWTQVLGWRVKASGWQRTPHGPDGVSISSVDGREEIDFRWIPDGRKRDKNRLHLDLNPTDRDQTAELARLVDLGATTVDVGQGDVTWHVLADPEGNEFCLCRERLDPHVPNGAS